MKLLVIDGNSIVNRAYYGMHPLNNQEGFPTHAIYGFLNILRRIREEVDPDGVCVAFDRKEPTFRHLAYPDYKAQRKGMPEELAVQMPVLKQVLDAMNIPRYELAGWEADDLIGTIAKTCEEAGWDCRVATGDKDSLQLVTDKTYIELVTTRMGKTTTKEMDPAAFQETYGFGPLQMVDLKALMGDTSDNIPGVPGVGEKTAMKLLHENGTLEQIYARLDDETLNATAGVKKKLTAGRESAFRSYDLCTIHRDAPIEFDPQENVTKPVNAAPLRALFVQLGFQKLIGQMGLDNAEGPSQAQAGVTGECRLENVTGAARWQELVAQWQGTTVSVLALPELAALSVCWGEDRAQAAIFREAETEDYSGFLAAFFRPEITKLGYHIKDVMRWALARGLTARGFVFDAAIAAYLLAPTDGSYALDKVAGQYFTETFPPDKDYLGSKAWKDAESAAKAMGAMASHAVLIAALYDVLPDKLAELGLDRVYEELELPLCPVLAEMEQAGMLVDLDALTHFGEQLKTGIAALQGEIWSMAGQEFNLNSTQQLGKVLFEDMGLPPVKKTKTGYSTSAEVLEKLRAKHPIVEAVMDYRMLTKLKSTYAKQNKLLRRNKPERIATRTEPLSGTAAVYGSTPRITPRFPHAPLKRKNSRAALRLAARPSDCHRYAVSTDSAIVGMPSARTRITHTTTVKIFFILAERSRCACARASRSFAALMRSLFCCAVSFCCLLPDFLAMGYSLSFPRISMTRAMCLATSTSMCHLSRS